jgi:protein-L-isoaspartate O-methyltransferase
MEASAADRANQHMVDRLIAEGALWSGPLIAGFRATPRHRFLDRVFLYQRKRERWREVITRDPNSAELRVLYSDRALITRLSGSGTACYGSPISSSSQPSLMAQMLEDLRPALGSRTLEVGAGTGYNAALLAHVTGPDQVSSVDVDREVLAEAWDHLRGFPERRVRLHHADGRAGLADAAPFDRIMVTAATPDLEPAWLEQLAPAGVLIAPLALAPGLAFVIRGTVSDGEFDGRLTRAAYFMPLRSEGEAGASDANGLLPSEGLRTRPAPWAGWFERGRPRLNWFGFVQSLACYGLLQGLGVFYRVQVGDQSEFGFQSGEASCWLGLEKWHVSDDDGRTLALDLWEAFLAAGGPWPTEYRIRARPGRMVSAGVGAFRRQGPHCAQAWEIIAPRERPAWL